MKRLLIAAFAITVLGIANALVYANDANRPKPESRKSYIVKGNVVAVDKAGGKVKLKHEAVPELEWPAMTMFFAVADKSQLDTVKAGDRVEFEFVEAGDGPLITKIKPVK